jgi:CDP-glucose 4,6-dehydratase
MENIIMTFNECFKNKVIIVTGHTGFKGSWLCNWLLALGANVVGISIDIPTNPSNYVASSLKNNIKDYFLDIRDGAKLRKTIEEVQPDYIFHLAAKSLVVPSYKSPFETYSTNALGTVNVLEAMRHLKKQVVAIMITSDKAYDNVEWVWGYRETDRLGGKDPYSASKGMAELAIRSYVESFFGKNDSNICIGIARAGNVIGGGDWAEYRIVPDCVKSWSKGKSINIRNPNATRPWQHVLEPLGGYLLLASKLSASKDFHGEAYNFGPSLTCSYSVSDLINEMSKYWDNVIWRNMSEENDVVHEAKLLKLNCDKARFDLGWQSLLTYEDTVKMTSEWYREFYKGSDINMISTSQIQEYSELLNQELKI